MSTKPIDYDALAAQHGGQPDSGANVPIDYDSLAASHGGVADTTPQTEQTPHGFKAWVADKLKPDATSTDSYGFNLKNIARNVAQGVEDVGSAGIQMLDDVGGAILPQKLGGDPITKTKLVEHIVQPMQDEASKARELEKEGKPYAGHAMASGIPLIGPLAGALGDQAATGDIGGTAARAMTQWYGGKAVGKVADTAGKVVTGDVPGVQQVGRRITQIEPAVKDAVAKSSDKFSNDVAKVEKRQGQIDTATQNRNMVTADKHAQSIRDIEGQNRMAMDEHTLSTEEAKQAADAANQSAAQKHAAAVEEAKRAAAIANQEAAQQHAAETQRIGQENTAAGATLGIREQLESDLAKKTADYTAKEQATNAKVKEANDANWSAVRQKVGDGPVDMEPVLSVIKNVEAEFPEAGSIIKKTKATPEDATMDPVDRQYLIDRTGYMKNFGYGEDYSKLGPEQQAAIDSAMDKLGLKPETSDQIDLTKPMTFEQVHNLKSNIGWKLSRGEYPPAVARGMKMVERALGAAEARTAVERGALDELNAARTSHADYMDAFGRVKPNRPTQMTARLKEANPEAYDTAQEEKNLAAAAKHDPTLVDDYKAIKDLREKISGMQKPDQLRKGLKQPPAAPTPVEPKLPVAPNPVEPKLPGQPVLKERPMKPEMQTPRKLDQPEVPTVDLQQEAHKAIAARAKNWGAMNARDIGIIGSALIAAPILYLLKESIGGGNASLLAPAAAVAYEGSKYAASRVLNNAKVVNWLSKTPLEEVRALSKIPGADRIKIVDGMTKIALEEIKAGNSVNLTPAAKHFLGSENANKIALAGSGVSSVPKNRKEAKQSIEQVQ